MFLYSLIVILHVIVCVILVLVVLLQSGKGADLAGAFGGGATQTAFGSRGPASFLSKMTTVAAVVFMLTSIGLSMISTRTESKSILETGKPAATQPAKRESTAPPIKMPSREQILRDQEAAEAKQKEQNAPSADREKPPASAPAEATSPAK